VASRQPRILPKVGPVFGTDSLISDAVLRLSGAILENGRLRWEAAGEEKTTGSRVLFKSRSAVL